MPALTGLDEMVGGLSPLQQALKGHMDTFGENSSPAILDLGAGSILSGLGGRGLLGSSVHQSTVDALRSARARQGLSQQGQRNILQRLGHIGPSTQATNSDTLAPFKLLAGFLGGSDKKSSTKEELKKCGSIQEELQKETDEWLKDYLS